MPGRRRGMVVPQNTFLENIVRRSNGLHPNFVLGNAQLLGNPIVYCSDGFCKLTGYSRQEIMKKNADCSFMYNQLTDTETVKNIHEALATKTALQVELIAYLQDGNPVWFLFHIGPIIDEKGEVMLFLVTVKDITEYKDQIPGADSGGPKGWARLNKSLTRHKSVLVTFKQKSSTQRNAQQITNLRTLNEEFLPEYKQDIPHTPQWVILHYNTFKTSWDWVILILTLYTTISVPFIVCFAHNPHALAMVDLLVDWLFIGDIILNFHTSIVGKEGEIIDDLKTIRHNYVKGWFFLDLVSSLPYGILSYLNKNNSAVLNVLGVLKVFRLLRLGRVARKIDKYLEYGASTFCLLMLSFCLVAHWMACIFYVIATLYDQYDEFGWLKVLGRAIGTPFVIVNGSTNTTSGPTIAAMYVSGLYYTLTSLTTIGFGNIAPTTTAEKLFGCVTMLLGSILFSLIFGQVSAILQQAQKNTAKYHSVMDNMKQFSKLYKLPQGLATRILDYFASTWSQNKGIDTDEVLKHCPKDLQADICVHMNRIVLDSNPAFMEANTGVKRALARNFWICHVAPGDRIIHHGESLDVLYFIAHGSLEVKQGEAVVGLLGEGDIFGDNVCTEPIVGQSAVDVHALTYSDLHCVQREALIEVLEFYPDFALKFSKNLNLSFNLRDEVKVRMRSSRVEVENENAPRSRAGSFRNRRGRKLSLVQELAQTYELDEYNLDSNGYSDVEAAASEMMVIPEDRKSTFRGNTDLSDVSGTDGVLSSLVEMKDEVRREIEVMTMKMTQLEEQISTILAILKTQGHLNSQTCTPTDIMHRGRESSTSYFEDSSQAADSAERSREKADKLQRAQAAQGGSKGEEDPALPDWLAPTGGSRERSDSIPKWEDHSGEEPSASAARLLNNDRAEQAGNRAAADPKLHKALHLMMKK